MPQARLPNPFTISVVPDGEGVVVSPAGELDIASVDALDGKLRDLRRQGIDQLVLDLGALEFLDSSGLRLLLSLRNDAEREGRGLRLLPGPEHVQRVFALTATRSLFAWGAA